MAVVEQVKRGTVLSAGRGGRRRSSGAVLGPDGLPRRMSVQAQLEEVTESARACSYYSS